MIFLHQRTSKNNMNINQIIATELSVKEEQVIAAVGLLDEGATVPFIARYRKEVTGNLTDSELRKLEERLEYLRNLEARIKTVLASIEEQGKLTDELKSAIENSTTLSQVEDLYRPYKPKRETRAIIAKEKGLVPLANYIKEGKEIVPLSVKAKEFINEEKGVNSVEEALQGADDIIAEEISDEAKYRTWGKKYLFNNAFIVSKEIKQDEKDTYGNYKDYKEAIKSIPSHRLLAVNRGSKEGCLRLSFDYDKEPFIERIAKDYLKNNDFVNEINKIIVDALNRLILPSIENEIYNDKFEQAEDKSIEVFKTNTRSLLMYPPLKGKRILGFDPGIRTGCKYALVNEFGIMEEVGVSFITKTSDLEKEKARLLYLLKKGRIDYIALGNGTASRESEAILRDVITKNNLPIKIHIVNESGASVYSASPLAEKEFPDLPVEKRSAISLARRLQDPLNELVKIDPKSIGVGQYQHDMNQKKLETSLHAVVEDCVNSVGVNLNNATPAILSYVSGIGPSLANNIYEYMKENGPFKNRSELKKVPKLGSKAFEQCAGFLRIYGGNEPLDISGIHPESYKTAKKILKETKIDILKDDVNSKEEKLKLFNVSAFLKNHPDVGELTLKDIIEEIKRPGRDIREDVEIVELNNDVTSINDLKEGMMLTGTVRNIMDFGMFVDINVHQDGLVHISEVSNSFVKDISSIYSIGDVVKVKVLSVDVIKRRIALSTKQAK